MKAIFTIIITFQWVFAFSQENYCDCFQLTPNVSVNHESVKQIKIENCDKNGAFTFTIYNRWGNVMVEISKWEDLNTFDFFQHKNNARILTAGTYYWSFVYTEKDKKKEVCKKSGFVNILD